MSIETRAPKNWTVFAFDFLVKKSEWLLQICVVICTVFPHRIAKDIAEKDIKQDPSIISPGINSALHVLDSQKTTKGWWDWNYYAVSDQFRKRDFFPPEQKHAFPHLQWFPPRCRKLVFLVHDNRVTEVQVTEQQLKQTNTHIQRITWEKKK